MDSLHSNRLKCKESISTFFKRKSQRLCAQTQLQNCSGGAQSNISKTCNNLLSGSWPQILLSWAGPSGDTCSMNLALAASWGMGCLKTFSYGFRGVLGSCWFDLSRSLCVCACFGVRGELEFTSRPSWAGSLRIRGEGQRTKEEVAHAN